MGLPPAMPNDAFIRMYASMARAPEYAMTLASKMARSSLENRDFETVMRWAHNHDELYELFESRETVPDTVPSELQSTPSSDGPTRRSAAE